jgi:uncharacterized membrane-anchored protein
LLPACRAAPVGCAGDVTIAAMTTTLAAQRRQHSGPSPNKIPEVDVFFWIAKILCLGVGAGFADSVTAALGLGLDATTALFLVAFCAVLVFQLLLERHVPEAYWLTVTVAATLGGLVWAILTEEMQVSVRAGTVLLTLLLVAVLAAWRAQEHTLSLRSIRTPARESFYWVAVLVSFMLAAAVRDATMQALDWPLLSAVALQAALCAAVLVAWRRGADGVVAFWAAFTLTGALGADLGDWARAAHSAGGLGLGAELTSGLFLAIILLTSAYRSSRRET